MQTFPHEFEALLGPRGRRILAGKDPAVARARGLPDSRFLSLTGVLDGRRARACGALLERALGAALTRMDQPIPPESLLGMTENYAELLPKTARVQTALLQNRRARAYRAAESVGVVAMLRSQSFGAFAAQLSLRPLRQRGWGIQALRYGPGDYAGPHNDHHPEDPDARDGYLDVHLTFAGAGVGHQWLITPRQGHLSEVTSVKTVGGVTAYRLPFWHYTTPLVARPGKEASAYRWVLLGTFLFAPTGAEG